jgi:deoxyribodipyrimidine photo-lyase
MVNNSVILWFRRDLRLSDNPALDYVSKLGRTIIPIYILDEVNDQIGAASRWWLHHSLDSLNKNLATKLNFFIGDPQKIITDIIAENNVTNIAWNRCYEPAIIARDTTIKEFLKNNNISVKTFNGSLLLEPHETLKDDKSNYKVFTPFYKKNYINNSKIRVPLAPSSDLSLQRINSLSLTDLSLIPKIKWYQEFEKIWQPGEGGANRALDSFMQNELKNYKELRDRQI